MTDILSADSSPRDPESCSVEECFRLSSRSSRAFSLVELMVVGAVVAVLLAMGLPALNNVRKQGAMAKEVNAGKTLIASYLTYAAEHNSELLVPHYEGYSGDLDGAEVVLPSGENVNGPALARYPYRLAPYFGYKVDDVILVNQSEQELRKNVAIFGSDYAYTVSMCSAFGINHYYTGYTIDDEIKKEEEVVRRLTQSPKPGSMLIFATAQQTINGKKIAGHYGVRPPKWEGALWGPDGTQNDLDPRHGGKVLAAFLDGSVRAHTVAELSDMRYWSPNAQRDDNPNYTVPVQGNSGIGGGSGGRR